MSKVEIEIPDDKWFFGKLKIRPLNKQLCVVIRSQKSVPIICFYSKANDQFVICDSIRRGYSQIDNCQTFSSEIVDWNWVEWWKPLGLPGVDYKFDEEIEAWKILDIEQEDIR